MCGALSDGAHYGGGQNGRGTPLVALPLVSRVDRGGAHREAEGNNLIAFSVKDHGSDCGEDVSPTLRAGPHDGSHANGGVMPAIAFDTTQITSAANYSNPQPGDPCHPLAAGMHPPAIAFAQNQRDEVRFLMSVAGALSHETGSKQQTYAHAGMQVRRLTPLECERLQGFPDGWTDVPYKGKPAADGPRYKALGNSMAVNVMRWIGERIASVERIAA